METLQSVACMCMSASPVVQYANSKYDTSQDIIFSQLRNMGERAEARLPTYSEEFLGAGSVNSARQKSPRLLLGPFLDSKAPKHLPR